MHKGLKKRVKELEEKLLPEFEHGSTLPCPLIVDVGKGPHYYFVLDIPEVEAQLQRKASEINQRYKGVENPELTPEERNILHVAGRRLFDRSLDLFENVWGTFFELAYGKHVKAIFHMHLYWFIHEMFRHGEMLRVENEIMEKYPKSWKKAEKALQEWENNREDKTPLWTQESFSAFTKPIWEKMWKK